MWSKKWLPNQPSRESYMTSDALNVRFSSLYDIAHGSQPDRKSLAEAFAKVIQHNAEDIKGSTSASHIKAYADMAVSGAETLIAKVVFASADTRQDLRQVFESEALKLMAQADEKAEAGQNERADALNSAATALVKTANHFMKLGK
jgi:hypothetical protein